MELKSVNNTETNKYELALEVSPEEFNDAINAVYKRESKKMNIPGFRKGHAPRAFIEKYYGEEVFFEAAVDHLYRPMVMEAVEKSELKVISIGDFKVDEIGKENGLKCTVTVVTKPEAAIEGYQGIEVAKEPVVVTDGDIDREIERVRERNSRTVTVEDRGAENGDIAVIDFDGYVDGKQFDGGKAENYELTLGAGQFIPGFEEQVVGHSTGEEFDVNVTFPEDYGQEDLNGKDAVFVTTINYIQDQVYPELTDDFVVSNWKESNGWNNVAEAKEAIKNDLRNTAVSNYLWQEIQNQAEVKEVPEALTNYHREYMVEYYAALASQYDMTLDDFLSQQLGLDSVADLVAQNQSLIENNAKYSLIAQALSEDMNVKPTTEDLAKYLRKSMGLEDYSDLEDFYGLPYLLMLARENIIQERLGEMS